MRLSVIISTWRRAGILRETLDSLAFGSQLRAAGDAAQNSLQPANTHSFASFEVIVVSDGEDAATRALSHSYSALPVEWIFHEHNLGLPVARNTGAARAQGDLLLFLDDDTPAAPGLLDFHAQAHRSPQADVEAHGDPVEAAQKPETCASASVSKIVVCGRIVESSLAEPETRTGRMLQQAWTETLTRMEAALCEEEADRIPPDASRLSYFGLNCSISRELFHAAGGFNPALRWSDEEMELGCRLYLRGVRFVSEPRAVVYHRNDKDMVAYFEQCWRHGGSNDPLRVQSGERSPQTRQLLGMDTGPWVSRLANRAFWHANAPARGLSEMLKQVTERTGWRASFRLWQETTRVQRYWAAVRESGTSRQQLRELAANPLRVLMLHSIAVPRSAAEQTYYLSPGRWRTLLETMRAEGYRCADPAKLEDAQAEWGEREVVLTFDDGYDDFYTEVFPLLESHGLKPLVFLVAGHIGDENRWDQAAGLRARRLMDAAQIRELQRHGVCFGSHTLTHPSLVRLGDAQLRRELVDSKRKLEDLLGEEVSLLAYPFGDANRRLRSAAIEAGYKAAFTTVEGLNLWEDPFAMLRIEFNEVLAPMSYGWKLRCGHGPLRSVKDELKALYRMVPREMKAKIETARG